MTGFDLSTNYVDDPEALLKRTEAKLKKVSALESEDNQIRQRLTPDLKPCLIRLSVNSLLQLPPTFVLDLQSMLETMDSSSSQLSSTWCKLASFMGRHMKMLVLISNTSSRYAALSPSKE
jgi:hypothetical protein